MVLSTMTTVWSFWFELDATNGIEAADMEAKDDQ